jgi:redox-sensitive bicupin YhaK (pirin superfamily)
VKIISGNFQGTLGPGLSHTPVLILDIRLNRESEISIPVTDGWNVFSFVYEGDALTHSKGQLAVYEKTGDIHFKTNKSKAGIYFAAGEPLNEPIARGGPFVMNTRGEILQAFEDYQNGKF